MECQRASPPEFAPSKQWAWYNDLSDYQADKGQPVMVHPEELLQRLRRRPFEPFFVHLSDGRVFEVRYPDMNLVFTTYLLLGIPEADHPDPIIADRFEYLDLSLISKIEPLTHSTPAPSR
jgi:hypothetical protein